ncbi:MAG: NAD-dependent epimerase/dehydratase family protein [Phycisphaerales bacterium]|nr:MAG: NAD-dependent epimerase/dehydratase family protein [Phycisphaerales bacterium]
MPESPRYEIEGTYRSQPVCVTGGAGFIGSHLTEALVRLGARVTVLDDFSNGRMSNLAAVQNSIRLVRGSILDPESRREACDGAKVIFHQAALASVPASVNDPVSYHEVNATGTLHLLEIARSLGNGCRVIYAGSSSAYGDQSQEPKVETMRADPLSPYATSKLAGELMSRAYAHCYGLPTLTLRYFNIFGPRQRHDSPYAAVVPIFLERIRRGEKPVIFGDGEQTRDFTHVANAVHANLLAGAAPHDRLRGEAVNIGCGESISLLVLLDRLAAQLGIESECEFQPPRAGDVKHSRASIDLARELIGYEPTVDFATGLSQTIEAGRILSG